MQLTVPVKFVYKSWVHISKVGLNADITIAKEEACEIFGIDSCVYEMTKIGKQGKVVEIIPFGTPKFLQLGRGDKITLKSREELYGKEL